MASSNTDSIEDVITCIICLKYFDDPRLLPCSHTYCLSCIKRVAATTKGDFECPMRDGVKIESKQIDSLPLNRIARDIIELRPQHQCSNCMVATAVEWCNDCKNRYCSDCSKVVHSLPAFKSHHITQGSMGSSMIFSCDKHPDEKLKYWCKSADCETVTCRDCLL
ncbi:unnamed protein product, partial [Adineta ricciae]